MSEQESEPTFWRAFKNSMAGRTTDGEKIPWAHKGAFESYRLDGPTLTKGLQAWSIRGAIAEFQHGANVGGRITLTRVAIAGPFALLMKKNRNKVYIAVQLHDGEQVLIEGPAKHEKAARLFAQAIERNGRHYAPQD